MENKKQIKINVFISLIIWLASVDNPEDIINAALYEYKINHRVLTKPENLDNKANKP